MTISRQAVESAAFRGRWMLACGAFYGVVITAYFARGLWRGDLIASEDAVSQYYPQFSYPYHAWTRLLFGGYPLFADPQNMSFLPMRLLLSALGEWNVFVLSAYVLAACWACLYAYEVTGDRLGALAAGLIYGTTGHVLWNFTLVTLAQSMAWVPLVFWALERGVRAPSLPAALIGAVALACTCFGGFEQILAYTVCLALAYAGFAAFRARQRWRYAGHASAVFALGALLSTVQWLPTVELLLQSQRTQMPYEQFAGWAWTWMQSAELLIPRAFLGSWSGAATSCKLGGDHIYLGMLPLILAGAGAWITRRSALTRFWCAAGAFSLALAFGDLTPLARWLYHVPPYNLFRVLIRHSIFLTLGVSVLSACAIAAVRSSAHHERPSRQIFWIASGTVLISFVFALGALLRLGCTSVGSPGVWVSFAALAASAVAVGVWLQRPLSPRRGALLVACVALDLLTFDGWGEAVPRYSGRLLSPPLEFEAPETAESIASELAGSHQRIWGVRGRGAGREELSVNRNLLWNVPSASGYSPIAPAHSLDVLNMNYLGVALGPFWSVDSVELDVAAVRLVTLADGSSAGTIGADGVRWADVDLGIRLGRAEGQGVTASTALQFAPMEVTAIGLVMEMGNSAGFSQGDAVATLQLGAHTPVRIPLVAGVDVSEWAIDCPSERDRVQHGRARVYDARPVPFHGAICPYQRYVSVKRLSTPVAASSLKLEPSGSVDAAVVAVHKVTLFSAQNRDGYALDRSVSELIGSPRWQPRSPVSPGRLMFENRRALPRARFVDAAAAVPLDGALTTLRTGRLPSGAAFSARHTALVAPGTPVETHSGCSRNEVDWLDDRDGLTSLAVDLPEPCFLVLADTFYEGWTARIDDRPTPIHRTNFAFRGVEVPAGKHGVVFEFASASIRVGAIISAASGAAALLLALLRRSARFRRSEPYSAAEPHAAQARRTVRG
jgi:hypothetical protein